MFVATLSDYDKKMLESNTNRWMDFCLERLIHPARRPKDALCAFSHHQIPRIVRQKAERNSLYCHERTVPDRLYLLTYGTRAQSQTKKCVEIFIEIFIFVHKILIFLYF